MNTAKKIGTVCFQLVILIFIYQLGNYIARFFHLKIPGNVIGMVILFGLLCSGAIKIKQIQLMSGWLLKHLGFFFIPISVGLMTIGPLLIHQGIYILLVLSVSAVIGLTFTGRAAQTLINRREEVKVKYHDHSV